MGNNTREEVDLMVKKVRDKQKADHYFEPYDPDKAYVQLVEIVSGGVANGKFQRNKMIMPNIDTISYNHIVNIVSTLLSQAGDCGFPPDKIDSFTRNEIIRASSARFLMNSAYYRPEKTYDLGSIIDNYLNIYNNYDLRKKAKVDTQMFNRAEYENWKFCIAILGRTLSENGMTSTLGSNRRKIDFAIPNFDKINVGKSACDSYLKALEILRNSRIAPKVYYTFYHSFIELTTINGVYC